MRVRARVKGMRRRKRVGDRRRREKVRRKTVMMMRGMRRLVLPMTVRTGSHNTVRKRRRKRTRCTDLTFFGVLSI